MNKRKNAFTILEIVMVMAVMVTLMLISLPVYQSLMFGTEVENATKIAVSTIRTAQAQSIAGLGDSEYGVRISSTSILLYKGADYATRDITADVNYTLPTGVNFSGVSDIVFYKRSGKVLYGIGNVIFSQYDKSSTIVINELGVQNY